MEINGGHRSARDRALGTHEVQLAHITKTHMTGWDPTRVFSSDKTIACVAHGFDLASCQNHDENEQRGEKNQGKDLVGILGHHFLLSLNI